jgi:hypothetical protein
MGPCSADAISRVCVAPCDLVVDGSRGQSFFFDGKRVTKSKEFSLSEYRGDVVARVRPGRPGLLGAASPSCRSASPASQARRSSS